MARRTRLELATTGSTVRYSNQLSYRPVACEQKFLPWGARTVNCFLSHVPGTTQLWFAKRYRWLSQSKSLLRYFLSVAETRCVSSAMARSVS